MVAEQPMERLKWCKKEKAVRGRKAVKGRMLMTEEFLKEGGTVVFLSLIEKGTVPKQPIINSSGKA